MTNESPPPEELAAATRPRLPAPTDPQQFARSGRSESGQATLAMLPRLAEAGVLEMGALHWTVKGERARDPMNRLREFIRVEVRFDPALSCVRCLEPVQVGRLRSCGTLRLAASESQAVLEDRDSGEVDVIAVNGDLDLGAVVEDEAILALPMAPTHAHCEGPPGHSLRADDADPQQD